MGHPAKPSSRTPAERTVYAAVLMALLITTSSSTGFGKKLCRQAQAVETRRKQACDWAWGVCFTVDAKGTEVSRGCTPNDLRALALTCRDATNATIARHSACGH